MGNSTPQNPPRNESALKPVGMLNDPGEENCFLNTALQALWNLASFRESIIAWPSGCGSICCCLVCGIKHVFDEFMTLQDWGELASGQMIRMELARLYKARNLFQLNQQSDAFEAMQALLAAIHSKAIGSSTQGLDPSCSNTRCEPLCPAHLHFGLAVAQVTECVCGEGRVCKWDFSTFSYPIYVSELLLPTFSGDTGKLCKIPDHNLLSAKSLSTVLPMTNQLSEAIGLTQASMALKCDHCHGTAQTRLEVETAPKVISISLVWPELAPSSLTVLQTLAALPGYLNGQTLSPNAKASVHTLLGMLLYSGSHYIAMFRDEQSGTWYRIDDSLVRKVSSGSRLKMLCECLMSRMHPVAVFYEAARDQLELDQDLTVKDWLEMERWALALDRYREGLDLEFAEPGVLEVQRVQYLEEFVDLENSANLTTPEVVKWTCDCGTLNPQAEKECGACRGLKPDVDGWRCSKCTFINSSKDFCEMCSMSRPETPRSLREATLLIS